MSLKFAACIVIAWTVAAAGAARSEEPPGRNAAVAADTIAAADLSSEVPALTALHDVVFPLWHHAWPDSDVAMMKDLLPRAGDLVRGVDEAALPGILRDKEGAWKTGVAALDASLERYRRAAEAGDRDALMNAVESFHRDFETLVRVVRPRSPELDAYHVELYRIVHRHLPHHELTNLRAAADSLGFRCRDLGQAPAPRWFTGDADSLRSAIVVLCGRTEALRDAAAHGDWGPIGEAVDAVHGQYRRVEALFD